MARLIYPDLVALIELQLDVLAGEYAAERDYDTRSEIPCMRPGHGDPKGTATKNGQPKKASRFRKTLCCNYSGDRTRTCDPLINSQLLYQLSYAGSVRACAARRGA